MTPQLTKTLTLPKATALAITMVVGSGLLILPGLVVQQFHGAAVLAWLLAALLSMPFLYMFTLLSIRFPNAGGIAGFLRSTFSPEAGMVTEVLFLGVFLVLGPAILITGGQYFGQLLDGGEATTLLGASLILLLGTSLNLMGAKLSGAFQQLLVVGLILFLASACILVLRQSDTKAGIPPAPLKDWTAAIPAVGIIFYAYAGWDGMSFVSEEFQNPRRDFPRMMISSFVIVVGLYLLVAYTVQTNVSLDDSRLTTAPVAAMLSPLAGKTGSQVVSAVATSLVLANFISWQWAASRLVYASAREGLLPTAFSHLDENDTPRRASLLVAVGFAVMLVLYAAGLVSLSDLFQMTGVHFVAGYLLCAIVFLCWADTTLNRVIGVFIIGLLLMVLFTFGMKVWFSTLLLVAGYALTRLRPQLPAQPA